jgi:hypothetical protein
MDGIGGVYRAPRVHPATMQSIDIGYRSTPAYLVLYVVYKLG